MLQALTAASATQPMVVCTLGSTAFSLLLLTFVHFAASPYDCFSNVAHDFLRA